MEIVEKDPFETYGDRVLLNLGHTFGHIVEETISGIKHGYAVSLGLLVESIASAMFFEEGLEDTMKIIEILEKFSLIKREYLERIDCSDISKLLVFDKKRRGEEYILVPLIYRIGSVRVEKLRIDLYSGLLTKACSKARKVLENGSKN